MTPGGEGLARGDPPRKPRAVVIDTNVVIAALLTSDVGSPTAAVLDGMLGADFVFLLSDALLVEYRTVMLRPAIRERHGLEEPDVDDLLARIVQNGPIREPIGSDVSAPDRGDQHLWDLAASERGVWVVTGDRLLLEASLEGVVVRSARKFVEALRG